MKAARNRLANSQGRFIVLAASAWTACLEVTAGYAHVEPHPKSQQKLRDGVRELLNHWTEGQTEGEVIRALNRKLKGWQGYFRYGHPSHVMSKLEYYLQSKLRRWPWKRHGKPAGIKDRYSNEALREQWGLYPLAWGGVGRPKANR